jgi:hypothetical protein
MTALEFEKQYAERGGFTVEQLRARRVVVPCLNAEPLLDGKCEWDGCEGWNSIPVDALDDYKEMGRVSKDWVWPP